jgi:hypothetical protein
MAARKQVANQIDAEEACAASDKESLGRENGVVVTHFALLSNRVLAKYALSKKKGRRQPSHGGTPYHSTSLPKDEILLPMNNLDLLLNPVTTPSDFR